MLNPGTMLSGRYEIIEMVGSGGMSEVYKAKCHVLNRFVAIKVLKPEFSSDVNFVTKFRIEAQSAAGLSHPNIVNVYDVGEDNGVYYIVMELVEGITLKEYIQKHGRIEPKEAIDFAIQIAQGVQAAHEHHTIHRDIKPQNIILANNGTLKVTDFGIAKAASSSTTTTNAMGSVHYISPEQARGGFSDERSDIYSLGITLYEMLTGHVPFEGENNVAIALMHIQSEMVSPREYYPDIPTSLEKIIRKCTQKKPERRYLTANALIADLYRVKENPNIDCIVVPKQTVPSSPTIEMTKQEMEMIKTGRQVDAAATQEVPPARPKTSEIQVNRPVMKPSQFDDLFPDDDDPEDEVSENDIGDDYQNDDEPEHDEDLDPRLKKIITVASVAIAVVLAILALVVIGNIAGWFPGGLFGGKATTEKTTGSDVLAPTDALSTTEQETIPMVNVVGLYKTAAEEQMKKNGFTNYTFKEQTDATVEKGYVISQSVDDGTAITKDTAITIVISSGKEMTSVPNVVNYEDSQATTLLEEAGLKVTHGYAYDDNVEKDHVISSDPVAGTEVEEGSTVKIIISNGKEQKKVVVPNLEGMSEADAAAKLTEFNLVGAPTYEYSDTVKEGQVISQDPVVNTEVDEQSTVSYVVSKGQEKVTYSVAFSGSLTNTEFDFDTFGKVNVSISYTIGRESYSVYSGSAGAGDFPLSIDGVQGLTGIETNSGTFTVTITDSEGIDVTSSFNTGGLSATFTQESGE
ncbi:Stk1 family PASTA domain-containing Ser/Thr kinase [Coprococcus eutactus]|uniref:non-specific serine/threonine protein kinase n=1 Tax=Coprococcus eutactus TaxID=33043 RepID=A0A3R5WLI5_9FIRM|nr:Stk1 family PASTA domain-containing Ser/Thr kinase [Coprococcus eutactus]